MNVHARETHHEPNIIAALRNQAALGLRAGNPHPPTAACHGRGRVRRAAICRHEASFTTVWKLLQHHCDPGCDPGCDPES
jgi:hypothetical protein